MKRWVKHLTQQRGYTDQMVEDANALIFTFGSFRLGVSISLSKFFVGCKSIFSSTVSSIGVLE